MIKLKPSIKTLLSPIAICLSLALATPAFAKWDGHHHRKEMRQIFSQLSLTATQKQDIRQIHKQSRQDRNVFKPDMRSLRQEIRALVQSSEWDQAAMEDALAERQDLMSQITLQRATNRHNVWAILTEEQRSEFEQIVTQRKTDRANSSEMKPGKRKGKRHLLKGLTLTESQQASIDAIKAAAKAHKDALKLKLKAFKDAEKALIRSSEFDSERWQALSLQYKDDFLALAVSKAKTKHDIWNTLTSEQQEKVAKKMGKRKGMRKDRV